MVTTGANEENILKQAGLSEEQAVVYEALLEKGPQKASPLSTWTGVKRGLVYKILDQLGNIGLVEKKGGAGAVAVFSPNHPSLLLDKIERDKKNLELSKEMVQVGLGGLSSKYNLIAGKPNVRFFEGEDGLASLYEDILIDGKDILLIRSFDDNQHPKIIQMVTEQIKNQVKKNIRVRTITPFVSDTKESFLNYDKNNLVERRIIPKGLLDIPSQIIIYGSQKVGITSFGKDMMTTIIDNTLIATTFKMLFEYIWQKSTTEHEQIINSFGSSNNHGV